MSAVNGYASVYLRRGVVIVASRSYLGEGCGGLVGNGWFSTGPDNDMDDATLGRNVRAAFAATQNNVLMPDFSQPRPGLVSMYAAVGVKTDRQFAKDNSLVYVELRGTTIELTPCKTDGKGMFYHLPEHMEKVEAEVDDATLGRQIRHTLQQSS